MLRPRFFLHIIFAIAVVWMAPSSLRAADTDDDAESPTNFKGIVALEERKGLLNYPEMPIYDLKNPPATPKLAELEKVTKVTQYGITWTFDKATPVGHFVNGDWYVVGPVTITMIDPKPLFGSEISEGFIDKDEVKESLYAGKQARNGSMLNPRTSQKGLFFTGFCGFDSRIPSRRYDPKLFTQLPIAMKPGDSLVSTISRPNSEIRKFGGQHVDSLRAAAVLTCVAEPQAPDAFRPSYSDCANSKPYLARNLHRELLLTLPRLKDMPPNLNRYARIFQRPWEDVADFGFSAPMENMSHYGQGMVEDVGEATLLLQMNYTAQEKERLLINLVQVGIDFWGQTRVGRLWQPHGGLNSGRKWPIVFAGMMLADPEMQQPKKTVPGARFAEDDQTEFCPYTYMGKTYERTWSGAKVFFVGHSVIQDGGDHGKWDDGTGPVELVDPKEWPRPDHPVLASEGYRTANTSPAWVAQALAARLMHAEKLWDHDAYFAYVDRWMTEDDSAWIKAGKDAGRRDLTGKKLGEHPRQGSISNKPKWVKELWIQQRNAIAPAATGEKTPAAETTWK